MKEYLKKLEEKFHLKIGDRELSPLSKATLGLVLEYILFLKKNPTKHPLVIAYPSKKDVCLHLATGALIQFFLEDYIYQVDKRFEQLNLNDGDRIRIFDEPTSWHAGNKIKITEVVSSEFGRERKETLYPIPKTYLAHINKDSTKTNRIISKEILNKKISDLRKNRRAIDKIIGTEEKYGVNTDILQSKILLVTGKGNRNNFIKKIKSIEIFNEQLSEIFSLDKNLLLAQNLEEYIGVFNSSDNDDSAFFKELFLNAFEESEKLNHQGLQSELLKLVVDNNFTTLEFIEKYERFLQELEGEEYEKFLNLKNYHPQDSKNLPDNLKAVIINDLKHYDTYYKTIQNFLERGIPVIILCDRHMDVASPPELKINLLEWQSGNYRINWNKSKIAELIPLAKDCDYLDKNVWNAAMQYSKQKIDFQVSKSRDIETIFFSLPQEISAINGFDNLKQAFWKILYPCGFLIKNTPEDVGQVKEQINVFTKIYLQVKSILPGRLQQFIEKAIDIYSNYTKNTKCFIPDLDYFVQYVTINNSKFSTPFTKTPISKVKKISENIESICFTGYPFNEKNNRLLADAVTKCFIPDIKLLLWEKESVTTKNYIVKLLRAGYFLDNLDSAFGFPNKYELKNQEDIMKEVEFCLPLSLIDISAEELEKLDSFFDTISYLRHSKYVLHENNSNGFGVKCNIVHLEDSEYIYLPHTSKILANGEFASGENGLKQCVFDDLVIGQTIYQYRTSRSDLRTFARANSSLIKAFKDLEVWRNHLQNLYEQCYNQVGQVETYLMEEKRKNNFSGNPSRNNIQRWLFDDDILSPEKENLKIILSTVNSDLDSLVRTTLKASSLIKGFSMSIGAQIKKLIASRISRKNMNSNREFTISIEGIAVNVYSAVIEGLEKNDVIIDYSYTRKILS